MYIQAKDFPFQNIDTIDFEFFGNDGDIPKVVCMVIQNIKTKEICRVWRDELIKMKTPPFNTGENTLFITYFAPAEIQSMLALNWKIDVSIIDLFAEFRCETNGNPNITRKGLVNALSYYELSHLIPEEKEEMRSLILSGGPWTNDQRQDILNYCKQDVVALSPLFNAMLKHNPWSDLRLNQALLRGRYMKAVGSMQHRGIPIDLKVLQNLDNHWEQIKIDLIETVNKDFGVYSDRVFKEVLFEAYLAQQNIAWPRLDSGRLMLDKDTFSTMSKRYPKVQPLHELRKTLSEFKLNKLEVGKDGRNRTLLSPFAAKTGRNQPSTAKFIFGPAKWVRGLIKPEIGMSLAYCDWSSQEIAIAAALSGDELLWKAYESGDPYIAFAIQAGLAPSDATKETHKVIRNRCKSVVLGINYGMSAYGIAQAAEIHILDAKSLLQKHRETYKKFWSWADNNKNIGLLGLKLETCFGWPIQVEAGHVKANTFLNWPMQAHGAEMMRIACVLAVERGLKLCAPIHDALLIEAQNDQIDADVTKLKECMSEASEGVLGNGKICQVDAEIVKYPDRYMDEQGQEMWDKIMILLAKGQGQLSRYPRNTDAFSK
ncbi:DNA polymerase [Alphaproteobacteria bacterium]|nr:DNA polymerase [Alphaproteobacteria bacterium]MDC3172841.1 DNA polymerase [Alphaproteobacteria bacterium]|tara:strand:- start:1295 stop:3091 length:1797 start_codon:yes stop_codon:yes gene_type:complete